MRVLFISLHHKRSLLFEEGINKLLDDGFPVLILNTGKDRGFGEFGVKHPNLEYIDYGDQISYDQGVVALKTILKDKQWDIIHFIDNDLFITNTSYIKKVLKDFEDSDFGFCSYFENGYDDKGYQDYLEPELIAEVYDQKFKQVEEYPGFKPEPHWENASMMFKRDAWDKLSEEDVSNGRLCIKALHDNEVLMGVKQRESILPYSHYGPGWFHVGALMSYYYRVEELNMEGLDKDSEVDQFRIGYFLAQQRKYQDSAGIGDRIYPPYIEANLRIIAELMGGESKCLATWDRLYEKNIS